VKPLRNRYGSVKPYTRHQSSCSFQHSTDYNACPCSKWLYVNQRGVKPRRYSLVTPSWAEAVAEASKVLDGFHPEIAEARKQKAEQAASNHHSGCRADVAGQNPAHVRQSR
jgi:hypothetical protein